MRKRLGRKFYSRNTLLVAKSLLGKYLVRKIRGKELVGKIVETEAYIGPADKASHAFNGRKTERSKTVYLEPGHIYIYLCYGMYWQFNITTKDEGKPECVLLRALEPTFKEQKDISELRKLGSGPGKLCRWMNLDKSFNEEDLTISKRIWVEDRGEKIKPSQVISTARVGIDYAGSWAKKPWRFYVAGNKFVSRK